MKIHYWLLISMFIYPSLAVSADGGAQPVTEQQVLRLTEIYVTQHYGAQPVTEQQVLRLTEIYVTQHYGEQTAQAQKPYRVKKDGEHWIISGKPPKVLGGNFRAVIGANGRLEEITHSK